MNTDCLKFRVWDKENKQYFEEMDYDAILKEYGSLFFLCSDYGHILEFTETEKAKKGNFIVEHCTGIKDKNGRLIYEGDIVNLLPAETEDHKERIVIWEKDHWTTVRKDGKGAKLYWNFGLHEIEVIGNIHEANGAHGTNEESEDKHE